MADVLINEQKFGDFNSPRQTTTIGQHQANGEFSEEFNKEVRRCCLTRRGSCCGESSVGDVVGRVSWGFCLGSKLDMLWV